LGALAEIADAQAASSPFETPAERVELPEAALTRLRDAAIALEPDAFVHSTWDGIARTLSGKRDVARVRAQLEPLARAHGAWPELEKALARADLESLEPDDAVRRLAAIETLARDDFDYWWLTGEARLRAKDRTGAVHAWRRALELRPNHPAILRRLGPELVRQNDPQGRAIIEQLLKTNPNDPQLTPFLGPGPWPEEQPVAPAGG
jgi:predicted Zn-dependent protease